jgi:hypothetical protein
VLVEILSILAMYIQFLKMNIVTVLIKVRRTTTRISIVRDADRDMSTSIVRDAGRPTSGRRTFPRRNRVSCVPLLTHRDKDGIYTDSTGRLYKLNRAGVRYPVDDTGTRIFRYADGRVTSRPGGIDSTLWEAMSRKKRQEYLARVAAKAESADASPASPNVAQCPDRMESSIDEHVRLLESWPTDARR